MTELSMYRKYGYAIKEVFPIYPEKNGLLYWGGGEDGGERFSFSGFLCGEIFSCSLIIPKVFPSICFIEPP
jgi:hypothetical protein